MITPADQRPKKFEDVEIVTAKMEFINQVYEAAATIAYTEYGQINPADVAQAARMLVLAQKIHVNESVTVSDKGFKVIINASTVDDNTSMNAFRMILKALNQLDGSHGTMMFGDPVRFTLAEVPELSAMELLSSAPL
jgi:hypothetical protein